jgi:hypothetical protein
MKGEIKLIEGENTFLLPTFWLLTSRQCNCELALWIGICRDTHLWPRPNLAVVVVSLTLRGVRINIGAVGSDNVAISVDPIDW